VKAKSDEVSNYVISPTFLLSPPTLGQNLSSTNICHSHTFYVLPSEKRTIVTPA